MSLSATKLNEFLAWRWEISNARAGNPTISPAHCKMLLAFMSWD